MSSIANGSWPRKRSLSASIAPSTASAQPSRLASPQPIWPSSDSTRTNSQRGATVKVSIWAIFIGSLRAPSHPGESRDRSTPGCEGGAQAHSPSAPRPWSWVPAGAGVTHGGAWLNPRDSSFLRLRIVALGDELLEPAGGVLLLLAHVHPLAMLGRDDRHDEAQARGGGHVLPVRDQLLVGAADVPDVAVEIVEPERIDVTVLLAKRRVPIDLVGQRIPGEADGRDADVPDPEDVGPFLPQPLHRFLAGLALLHVGLGVHDRE